MKVEKPAEKSVFPIITVSREPGSGGSLIAKKLADKLELNLFHQQILQEMAEKSKISAQILKTLDPSIFLKMKPNGVSSGLNRIAGPLSGNISMLK